MQTDVLALAGIEGSETAHTAAEVAWTWIRQGLAVSLVVVGVLLTLWILMQLGPVAYGLPAPLFRRTP